MGFHAGGHSLLILSLDTTTRAGSAAVARDGAIVAETTGDPAVTHGQRLPGELTRVLEAGGAAVADLDLLAVAAGPGSFTGLRVGIATLQGLAFAAGLKIVPVSTLDALARWIRRHTDAGTIVAPWIDAQRGEVFAAMYDADLHLAIPPSSASPEHTLQAWAAASGTRPVVFAGDGAIRYAPAIVSAFGSRARVIERVPALAGVIAQIAGADPARAVLPHAVVPIYVRRPDAELARERGAPSAR